MNLRTHLRARVFFSSTASSGRPFLQSKPSAASARRSSVLLAFRRDAPAVIITPKPHASKVKMPPQNSRAVIAASVSSSPPTTYWATSCTQMGVAAAATPRQLIPTMPKVAAKVMPTASRVQPALWRFLALIRILSTGVGSGFAKICRNQPGIPAACGARYSSFRPCSFCSGAPLCAFRRLRKTLAASLMP